MTDLAERSYNAVRRPAGFENASGCGRMKTVMAVTRGACTSMTQP